MYEKNYVLGRLGIVSDEMPTPAPTVTEEIKSAALGGSAKTAGIGALLGYFIGGKNLMYALIGGAIGFFGGKYIPGMKPVSEVADETGRSEIQVLVDALNEINPEGIYAPTEVEALRTSAPANYWNSALIALQESNEDQFYALKLDELSF